MNRELPEENHLYFMQASDLGWVVGKYKGLGSDLAGYRFIVLSSEKEYFSNSWIALYWGQLNIKMLPSLTEVRVEDLPLYMHGHVTKHMEDALKGKTT